MPKTPTKPAKEKPTRGSVQPVPGEHISPKTAFVVWREKPGAIDELCDAISTGQHLVGWCKARGFPYTTARVWIDSDRDRSALYARAREDRADVLADEIVEIADEREMQEVKGPDGETVELRMDATAVQRNRLRVDARKWSAAKLKPRVYADKIQAEVSGPEGKPLSLISDEVLERFLAGHMAKGVA